MKGVLQLACGVGLYSLGLVNFLCAQGAVERPLQAAPPQRAEPVQSAPIETREQRPAAPTSAAPAPAISAAAGDYVLSVADTLEMTIFREADLASRSRIGSDGTVQLPLIGDIKVAGLTVRAARELIRKRYDADYLVDPQIYLNVTNYAQRSFTILGQVAKPGTYEMPGGKSLTLLESVGMAGGFSRTADRGSVIVKRATASGPPETIRLNAKKLAGEGKESFEVLPGDVITVGESWF